MGRLWLTIVLVGALVLAGSPGASATPFAYITNSGDATVSVIDTATNTVLATVAVGTGPYGVAVTPDGAYVYVANSGINTVSVIDTATNAVVATVAVGQGPVGVAVAPDGAHAYVVNSGSNTVSVIDTATNTVGATVPAPPPAAGIEAIGIAVTPDGAYAYVTYQGDPSAFGSSVWIVDTATDALVQQAGCPGVCGERPVGVAVAPDGAHLYVTINTLAINGVVVIDTATNTAVAFADVMSGYHNKFGIAVTPDGRLLYVTTFQDNTVSVIDTATNAVVATVAVGVRPFGVAVTADGAYVYVANSGSNTVSVIDTATNAVVATVAVGSLPLAFGQFIQPISAGTEAKR